MKPMKIAAVILIMLSVSVIALVSADEQAAAEPVTITPSGASMTMTFWTVGTGGTYLDHLSPSGTLEKDLYSSIITIPPKETAFVATPLTLPSDINGMPTQVRKVYLFWKAEDTNCYISNYTIGTANRWMTDQRPCYVPAPPFTSAASTTFDIGKWCKVPRGLTAEFIIRNEAENPNKIYIGAYGATIRTVNK